MSIVGIIPARLQSTRLPRKLLLAESGAPLLSYAWRAATRARRLHDVLIATDSEEIADVARGFGANCVITGEHPSGTDRIAEAARVHCPDAHLLVNIQGDEPELDAGAIDQLVELLEAHPAAGMATLATPITAEGPLLAPSSVKVVCAQDGRALYFSRSPIPHVRDRTVAEVLGEHSPWLLHIGVYAYRSDVLQQLTQWPPSLLEQLEKLEQLRALEHGVQIQVGRVAAHSVGIDTPADYAAFLARHTPPRY